MRYTGTVNVEVLKFVNASLDRGGYTVSNIDASAQYVNAWYEGVTGTGKTRFRVMWWNDDREEGGPGWDVANVYVDMETMKADY